MTRKHFIALADSLGLELRISRSDEEAHGIWRAITAIVPVLQQANSSFDQDRFTSHIQEVAMGDRKVTT